MTREDLPGVATTRLRVLNSLPRRHQDYCFAEVRRLCAVYIASLGLPPSERQSATLELVSEVMAKLAGASTFSAERTDVQGKGDEPPHACTISDDPGRDGRVVWLIGEVGGSNALRHRQEDIRRRLHGRWREGGYRTAQLGEEHVADLAVDPEDPHRDQDSRKIWQGVLAAAASHFRPEEDVSVLLDLLAHDDQIQSAFGAEWPVSHIVVALNQKHPHPPWTDDRVDNAKRRLRNWIGRIRRDHGLDSTGLMDLFARCLLRPESISIGTRATIGDRRL